MRSILIQDPKIQIISQIKSLKNHLAGAGVPSAGLASPAGAGVPSAGLASPAGAGVPSAGLASPAGAGAVPSAG